MYHLKVNKINGEHHFFTMSHSKSPCDGIGGTTKREATKVSLQVAITNQITQTVYMG